MTPILLFSTLGITMYNNDSFYIAQCPEYNYSIDSNSTVQYLGYPADPELEPGEGSRVSPAGDEPEPIHGAEYKDREQR